MILSRNKYLPEALRGITMCAIEVVIDLHEVSCYDLSKLYFTKLAHLPRLK